MSENSPHHHRPPHRNADSSGSVSSHRRQHRRSVDAVYEMQKAQISEIITQNIGLLQYAARRLLLFWGLVGFVLTALCFALGWLHYGAGVARLSVFCIAFFGVWLLGVEPFYLHQTKVIHLKALLQFQETRIDALKISLARQERKIEELFEKLREDGAGAKEGKGAAQAPTAENSPG